MAIKIKKIQHPEEDFQMAPMIDMVFLLLVFFMCVSTMAQAEKKELTLPESAESEVADDLANRGIISLDAAGNLYIGAEQVTFEAMQERIKQSLQENPRLKVFLRAEQETPFAEIKKVLKACAEAGAYEVIYATHQSGS